MWYDIVLIFELMQLQIFIESKCIYSQKERKREKKGGKEKGGERGAHSLMANDVQ